MAKQPEYVDVTAYLVVEPKWNHNSYWQDDQGRPILSGGRVTKATQQRPTLGKNGGVITKVTLRIDSGCFLPLQPEAVVHLHPGNAETIEVEAVDPREEQAG